MNCKLFPLIIFLIFAFFFSLSRAGSETIYENTTRSGYVYSNERWRGTIYVTGDVMIKTGASVVIEPGTIVKFAANSDDQMIGLCTVDPNVLPGDPEMLYCRLSSIDTLGGNLYAVGTPDKKIVFTSSASNPKRGDWHGILYHQRGSKLTLQHAIIEYGTQGVAILEAADDTHILLRDNIIRHIVTCGICVGYNPNEPVTITISGNDISDCGHEAIDTSANANLLIENNILHDNLWSYGGLPYGGGIVIHENNSTIRNNQFIRNRRAIDFLDENSRPNILGNSFIDNDANCFGFCPDPLQIEYHDNGDLFNDTTEFVRQQYRDFLNREADTAGLQHWVNMIDSGAMTRAQVIESFLWSEEFGVKIAPILRLYFAYFLRIPDYDGLMYWINQFSSGQSLESISGAFASSTEFQQTYGSLNNEAFVNLIYQNVLGRTSDPVGYAYWVGELNSGRRTRGRVMLEFSESAEYKANSSNEVFVTMIYVGMLRRSPEEEGFSYWVNYLDSGNPGLGLIDGFLSSQEYASRF